MEDEELGRLCVLTVHTSTHSGEDLILHPDFYHEISVGQLIQIYDPEHPSNRLILRVPNQPSTPSRVEISILKSVAESVNLVHFAKVFVAPISEEDASLDFVELSFKKQYLQRGNMFRFKNALLGRTIHVNQNVTVISMQAHMQELRKNVEVKKSGLITDKTKFVFRSKSSRIIWLVQVSAEMWDIDQVSSHLLHLSTRFNSF
jgi:hypothetical protein